MARKRKTQMPADPQQIARQRAAERQARLDPGQWGIDRHKLDLEAQRNVSIQVDLNGRAVRARRQDVFDLLLRRGSLARAGYEAVRRLQEDIAVLHRTISGGSEFTPRVDRSRQPEGFTVARQRAGERIDAVLALAGPLTGGVIRALCEADVALGQPADWRIVIATHAGERLPDAQGAILRFACENLAGAYAALDRRGRNRI